MFLTAIVGMGLIMVGNVIRVIGSRGWAGSGVVLDPQQARQDLEPYSRMVGGMAKDTLDEMGMNFDANRSQSDLANDEPRVKIRCRSCQQLSDETARFCSNCGHAL